MQLLAIVPAKEKGDLQLPKNRQALRTSLLAYFPAQVEPSEPESSVALRFEKFLDRHLVHAFEYRGRRYLVDPVTGIVFRIEDPAYGMALALAAELRGIDLARAVAATGLKVAGTLLLDLERMSRQEGMFLRARLESGNMVEQAVQSFLDHHPRKMMLCVSQTCNLRCVYCYAIEGNYHDEGKMMALETAQQAMRFLAQRAGKRRGLTTTLFGGEPLINFPMIKQLVPWAKAWAHSIGKRAHFCITTNGTLLSDEAIDFVIEHNMSILISLDGPKEMQDISRPNAAGKGSFDAAAPRIRRLLEKHPYPEGIKVRATMTHQNHDVGMLAKFFEEFGFRRIGLGANVGYSFYKGPHDLTTADRRDMYRATEEMLDGGVLESMRKYKRVSYDPVANSLLSIHADRDRRGPYVKIPCGVGRNDQGIDVEGKVYPCHRYVGMSAYVIGDIWKGVTRELIGDYYRRVLHAYKECGSCWATRWCAGHCPNYLSDPTGKVFGPDDAACDGLRGGLERNLALYDTFSEEGMDWERLEKEAGGD